MVYILKCARLKIYMYYKIKKIKEMNFRYSHHSNMHKHKKKKQQQNIVVDIINIYVTYIQIKKFHRL